jgi:hypothetical protein
MTLDEFTGIVTELSDFYERKQPKINTIDLWYRSIKRIPSEPVKWIARHIEDNYESFPKNIVSALWGGYAEWQQAHPDKAARESFFHCADCSEGLIFASKINQNNTKYKYVFRCIKCKQNHMAAYPEIVRAELISQGYTIIHQ